MKKELYIAQPKQVLFHNAEAEEVLYGGAAGGGKTHAILWDAVSKALRYNNIRIGVFRRTYPELEKSIIYRFLKDVPQELYNYSKQEHRATFIKTKSVIDFNHVQYESDVHKFQSVEYDFIYFDELTHFTEFQYQYLLSRLRTSRKGLTPQVKSGSNPGNIGHLWVKRRFIDGAKPYKITKRVEEFDGGVTNYTTQFIPATLYDNAELLEADPKYEARLKRLPEAERKALLEGDWDAFKGQYFTMWNKKKHICKPFDIPRSWKRFRAMDWGFANPSAVLWFAISPEGKIYVYRELYVRETTIPSLAEQIIMMSVYQDDMHTPEHIDYTVADPAIWSRTQYEQGESIAMKLMEHGVPLMKADNARISGWQAVKDVLYYDDNREPVLQVFETCYNLIRTLPVLVHDKNNPEDLDTLGEDHAADALRYGIMSNPQARRVKSPESMKKNIFDMHFSELRRDARHRKYV